MNKIDERLCERDESETMTLRMGEMKDIAADRNEILESRQRNPKP